MWSLIRDWLATLRRALCPPRAEVAAASADEVIVAAPETRPTRSAHRPIARVRRRIVSPFGQGRGRSRRRGPSRPINRLSR